MKKNMRKRVWISIGIAVAVVLLLWWLYAATLITEDENESVQDPLEQTN